MAGSMLIRTASLVALIAIATTGSPDRAVATDQPVAAVQLAAGDVASRFIQLGIGKSVVIDLPRDVKDVLVADPRYANAVVRSSRRAYIIGVAVGQTNVFFFDADGRQIAGFDIAVTRDLNGTRAALRKLLPHQDVRIDGVGDSVVLSGTVASPNESQTAYDIASRLVGDSNKVVNALTIRGKDQVMLKVTVAEVQRDVVKQLGVDLNGSIGSGTAVVNFNSQNPFSAFGQPLTDSSIAPRFGGVVTDPILGQIPRFQATVRAMERAGLIRTLAEPNLTAISGESATFLAGGEFPFVNGTSGPPSFSPTIEFKKFGVSLNFTPVVLSEGRISLRVLTEVSELSTEGALQQAGFTIPSLKVRRAETTLEIPSGGSLAMAGMIKEQTKQAINGLPGLMQLPVLGTLFKSRDYINNQTELMILVTPFIARAVAQKELSRPDDGYADPSDPASVLLGRLNRIYGVAAPVTKNRTYHGKYGFILD